MDATAQYCDQPLLLSLLPGAVHLGAEWARPPCRVTGRQLLRIHWVPLTAEARPRAYRAWTEWVTPPNTDQPGLWQRVVDVTPPRAPEHRARFPAPDSIPG